MGRSEVLLQLATVGKAPLGEYLAKYWKTSSEENAELLRRVQAGEIVADSPLLDPTTLKLVQVQIDERATEFVKSQMDDAEYAAKSGAIVLAHSTIDWFLHSLIRATCQEAPLAALLICRQRKAEIGLVWRQGVADTIKSIADNWIEEIERQSLETKLGALSKIYQDTPAEMLLKNADLRQRLDQLDKLRHVAVHGDGADFSSFDLHKFVSEVPRELMLLAIVVRQSIRSITEGLEDRLKRVL